MVPAALTALKRLEIITESNDVIGEIQKSVAIWFQVSLKLATLFKMIDIWRIL